VADRISMLLNGRIIEVGTVDEIKNTSNRYVHQFITGQSKISVDEEQ
jgi:phospholipid/cholesterol/gamma-HCH transport system ATP-binding protein